MIEIVIGTLALVTGVGLAMMAAALLAVWIDRWRRS